MSEATPETTNFAFERTSLFEALPDHRFVFDDQNPDGGADGRTPMNVGCATRVIRLLVIHLLQIVAMHPLAVNRRAVGKHRDSRHNRTSSWDSSDAARCPLITPSSDITSR